MDPFKVVIVEDVKLELKGTEQIFRSEIPEAEIIGTAQNESEYWKLMRQQVPDLVLLDLGLGGSTTVGVDICRQTRARYYSCKILIFTGEVLNERLWVDVLNAGADGRTVHAFGLTSRFVHLEFFCLNRAHKGLGDEGDFVALEVNMRPGGGFTPDMINYAHNVDVYKIWADMITYDRSTTPEPHDDYFCVFAGRRDNVEYHLTHDQIMERYGYAMCQSPRIPEALSGAMGNQSYIARFRTIEERDGFLYDVCNRK